MRSPICLPNFALYIALLAIPACGPGTGDSSTLADGSSSTGDGDGDGDGDATSGNGDGDPCSLDMPCSELDYCDLGGNCGVFGEPGICRPRPEGCDPGGPGACSCSDLIGSNTCDFHLVGIDQFRFGGCTLGDPGTFACGDIHCDTATEFCGISFNDIGGPNEPEYFASCMPLPDGCGQGDCACIIADLACYAGTGNAVVFYPGG